MTWAVTHAGVMVQLPNFTPQVFVDTYTPNALQTLVTAGAANTGAPSKIVAVLANSTETANARVGQLWITRSGTSYLLGSCNIPVNSGNDGTAASINMFSLMTGLPTDNDGQVYILLMNGDKLDSSLTGTPASGKKIHMVPVAADF